MVLITYLIVRLHNFTNSVKFTSCGHMQEFIRTEMLLLKTRLNSSKLKLMPFLNSMKNSFTCLHKNVVKL